MVIKIFLTLSDSCKKHVYEIKPKYPCNDNCISLK